jgi:hypothetical protein
VTTTPPAFDVDRILRGLSKTADRLEESGHPAAALEVRTAIREARSRLDPCAECNGRGYTEDAVCLCPAGEKYRDAYDAQHDRTMKALMDAHGRVEDGAA